MIGALVRRLRGAADALPELHEAQLLMFAHVPPPHHGQSYMVQVLLEGLRRQSGPRTLRTFHVDVRYSSDARDVGRLRLGKVLALPIYCARALALRRRTGVQTLYFVPAPPRRVPVLRDIATLVVLRPFFPRLVLHWHAAGLGAWLRTQPVWLRKPAHALLSGADLSIALARYSEADARELTPKRSVVVPYGISDPFPDFATELASRRQARAAEIHAALSDGALSTTRIRLLFLALCTREKGLFDALSATERANEALAARGVATRFELHAAGAFADAREQAEVAERVARPGWEGLWHYHGFVNGLEKRRLLASVDLFLFPTFYSAESFPVVVLEAMAAGLPIVTTIFRALPEMLPSGYPGLVPVGDVAAIAEKLPSLSGSALGLTLRAHYQARFTLERFLAEMTSLLVDAATT